MSQSNPSGLTRRSLLKTVSAGAGLAAVSSAPVTPLFGGVAPSERITLGFIGIGKMNSSHLEAFSREEDVEILALCDVESERLDRGRDIVSAAYQKAGRPGKSASWRPDAYRDFRDLLARADIDAVVIATPDHWHAITSICACRAGKDVYCEKPLANSIGEARAMVEAAARYGRVFQTGSMQRSDRTFRFACELARNGRLGQIHTVHVNVGGPPQDCFLAAEPCPRTLDWNLWLGPAPERPYHSLLCPMDNWKVFPAWRDYREFGGGGMTDWGAHHFDIAQWGLGMDTSGPVEIIPPELSDKKLLAYRYANGVTMYHGGAPDGVGTEFIGTRGRVGVNRSGFLKCDPPQLRAEIIRPQDIQLYASAEHRRDWLECIKKRSVPICPAETGCRSVTVCHLGNIAYQLKRTLRWDPVQEKFIGDEKANQLIHRPFRSPWTL